MMHIKQNYLKLVQLTQLYLLREYEGSKMKVTDPKIYAFFQNKNYSSSQSRAKQINPRMAEPFSKPPKQLPQITGSDPGLIIVAEKRPTEPRPKPSPPKPTPPPTQPEPPPKEPLPPNIQKTLVQSTEKTQQFNKEPLLPKSEQNLDDKDVRQHFSNLFPHIVLTNTIPNDAQAIKVKDAWKEEQMAPILLLTFQYENHELLFLKNIANAISHHFFPARLFFPPKMESEKSWEQVLTLPHLRLIIACDNDLFLQTELMKFYVKKEKHYLNHVPLLLLSHPSLYLKEPKLKALLWRAIVQELSQPLSHLK